MNETLYRVFGEEQVFTKPELRDLIRQGRLLPDSAISQEGNDDFRPAGEFPELSRYFSLTANA